MSMTVRQDRLAFSIEQKELIGEIHQQNEGA